MFTKKIGIDLGTANTLVYTPGRGIIVNEPTVVAVSVDTNRILAVGAEAKEMVGRAPDSIMIYKPMKDGVIADYRITQAMLRYFINKALGPIRLFRPEVMVAVSAGITSTERRAVIDATIKAGAKAAYVVKEPFLAAIGAGLPINEPTGHMIIDIGGGTTEVAIISLGGIVVSASARIAGNKIDAAISDHIKKRHNLAISERAAEEIKITIGSALPLKEESLMEVRGRDLVSGLPKTVTVRTNEVTEAISDQLAEILKTIKSVLQQTPPELAADVMDKGMVLSGGTGTLRNLDELISQATDVPCYLADNALYCVARGAGLALEHLDVYKRSVLSKRA